MSDLIAIGYDTKDKAEQALALVGELQKEHLITLEDAAVVVRDADGKTHIKQGNNLIAAGAVGGGFWGLLIGIIFLNPLLGAAAGAAAGAVAGAMTDVGIDDNFIKEVGNTIQPDSSALFLLVRQATPDKVIERMRPLGGTILRTSLTTEDENRLRAAIAGQGDASQAKL